MSTSICLSVRLFRLSVCPPQPASYCRNLDEQTVRYTDRRTDKGTYAQISPVIYRTPSPLGPLPCLCNAMLIGRIGVPLTVYCCGASGSGLSLFQRGLLRPEFGKQTKRLPLIPQDFLGGRRLAYITATIVKYQGRGKVPITISSLWASGSPSYCCQRTCAIDVIDEFQSHERTVAFTVINIS